MRAFRTTEEQDLAICQLLDVLGTVYDQRVAVHRFATNNLIERRTERVVAEHADDNRCARGGKRLGRPIHELCEVEEKDSLDLRGGRSGEDSAGRAQATGQQPACRDHPQAPGRGAQNSHAIFPYTLRLRALRRSSDPKTTWWACSRSWPSRENCTW